ncbi:hypothetical protein SRABI128_02812 [Microbacterium sp. Bi128]|nr:hypothetical protein SRABI128_02812 [Microbacterium sp. Bi128]
MPGPRGRPQRARRRAHRRGQDHRGRVRDPPGDARAGRQGVLHDAHQGAVEPEVPRAARGVRRRRGGPAHRRHQHQRLRADRRDDDRSAAQHAVRRLSGPARLAVRRDGRSALPRRPLPRCRVGRGHHPLAALGAVGVAVGDRVQRRGVRRLARHGARRHRGDRVRDAARPARAARARTGRPAAALRRSRRGRDRPGEPGAAAHPRRARFDLRQQSPGAAVPVGTSRRRPTSAARRAAPGPRRAGPPHRAHRPSAGRRPAATQSPAAGDLLHLQSGRLRRRRAATAAVRRAADLVRGARRDPSRRRRADVRAQGRGSRGPALLGVAREPRARPRRPPRRAAPGLQRGRRRALPSQARQGRLRHRDPRPGHQHARPHRRAREAREVQRRSARGHHLGRVHAAHRARRSARDRRRGPRRRAVD